MGERFIGKKSYTPILFGKAILHHPEVVYSGENRGYKEELKVLQCAVRETKREILELQQQAQFEEQIDSLFDLYLLFLEDDVYIEGIIELIQQENIAASIAITRHMKRLTAPFLASENPLIRRQYEDLSFLSEKLIHHLDHPGTGVLKGGPGDIIVARVLSPLDLITYYQQGIRGLVLESGDTTSHTAIIAHELGCSYVVGVQGVWDHVTPEIPLVLHGYTGMVYLNPASKKVRWLLKQEEIQKRSFAKISTEYDQRVFSQDKREITIQFNLDFFQENRSNKEENRSDIGLLRTEFLFYQNQTIPSMSVQRGIYQIIAERFYPRRVTIRTFDFSPDKTPHLMRNFQQENPAMGIRGYRFAKKHHIFKPQIKALIQGGKNIDILVPMVTTLQEVEEINDVLSHFPKKEHRIGIMVETPSSLFLIPQLTGRIDFISFGTNDLMQFFFAADRSNALLHELKSPFEPTFIRFLMYGVDLAVKNGIPFSICGEIASMPIYLPVLLGIGFRSLSIVPPLFLLIQELIGDLVISECEALVKELIVMMNGQAVERRVIEFLHENSELAPLFDVTHQ